MGDDCASKMFLAIDTNRNGVISVEELRKHCTKSKNPEVDVEKILKTFDTNKDREISYKEFTEALGIPVNEKTLACLEKSNNLPNCEKPYTESNVSAYISKCMDMLQELQESDNIDTISQMFKKLNRAFSEFKAFRPIVYAELIKHNFPTLSSAYISRFNKMGYSINDDVWYATCYAFKSLTSYTNCKEIANKLLETSLPQVLISNVLHQPFLDDLHNTSIFYLMKSNLGIIYNIVRFPGNEGIFKIDKLKNCLVNLIKRNDSDMIGVVSMLSLARLVDENELHLLEAAKNTIKNLIKLIKQALGNDDKRIEGIGISELLIALTSISTNDNMKKTFVQENGIQLVMDIIKAPECEKDTEKCLRILWNLCFDKDIKNELVTKHDLVNVMKSVESVESVKIKRICEGISWLIDEKSQSKKRITSAHHTKLKTVKAKWKFDLFLSYSWANKATVIKISDELKKSKIKVWLDLEQMQGSTLEAMADGIENSNIFVIAISDAYRASPNCRTEAEYAHHLHKPIIPLIVELKYKPTSWLGIIMGSKTYYEFTERRNFTETFQNFMHNIKIHSDNTEIALNADVTSSAPKDVVDSVKINVVERKKSSVSTWSCKDVENWLLKYELGHLKSKFVNINGKLLNSMIDINSKSPEHLISSLKIEFKMKLIDILKLKAAINDL